MRKSLPLLCSLLLILSGCAGYRKRVPSGTPLVIDNVYARPGYDHAGVVNVLVLPINNPMELEAVERHGEELVRSLLRNFGKFNYFNVQFDRYHGDLAGPVMHLSTGRIDRTKLGELGYEYGVQAVMQVDVEDFRPFPPMRLKARATIIDCETGNRIWAFDHTFDGDDAAVINGLRYWWNTEVAGGDERNRYENSMIRPSMYMNFVFHTMARSYERTRVNNVLAIEDLEKSEKKRNKEIEKMRKNLNNY